MFKFRNRPHEPYSVEELSSMDDAELGGLYRKSINGGKRNPNRAAFDNLFNHDDSNTAIGWLEPHLNRNSDGELGEWSQLVLNAINGSMIDLYSDEELGTLLKLLIPVLSYLMNADESLDESAFMILDKEYHLRDGLNAFMDGTYADKVRILEDRIRKIVRKNKAELEFTGSKSYQDSDQSEPHGPYSISSLYNMDDYRLGQLFMEKNKYFKTTVVDNDIFYPLIIITGIGLLGIPPLTNLIQTFIIGGDSGLSLSILSVAMILCIAHGLLCKTLRNHRMKKYHELGYDSFEKVYSSYKGDDENKFRSLFSYLESRLSTKYGDKRFNEWTNMYDKAIRDGSYSYSDMGKLLKMVLPILVYLRHSDQPIDEVSFKVLDEEYHLTDSMRTFMDESYTAMKNDKSDSHEQKVERFVRKSRSRLESYREKMDVLDRSDDYQRFKDLNDRVEQRIEELANRMKTEAVGHVKQNGEEQ